MSFIQKYYWCFTVLIMKDMVNVWNMDWDWVCGVVMELSAGYLQDNKWMRKWINAPLYGFENTSVFIYEKEIYIIVEMGKNYTEKQNYPSLHSTFCWQIHTDFRMKELKTYKPKSPDEIMCNVSSSHREMGRAHRSLCVKWEKIQSQRWNVWIPGHTTEKGHVYIASGSFTVRRLKGAAVRL